MSQSTSILLLGDGAETSRLRQRLARHFLAVESARTLDESRELGLRCRFHLLVLVVEIDQRLVDGAMAWLGETGRRAPHVGKCSRPRPGLAAAAGGTRACRVAVTKDPLRRR